MFGSKKRRSPEDDIRKLSRTELLEILIEETKEAERLREENKRLTDELTRVRSDLERSASLQVIMERLERITGTVSKTSAATQASKDAPASADVQ